MDVLPQAGIGGNDLCASIRFRHLITKIHGLGPRPGGEILARLVRLHPEIEDGLLDLLEEYSRVDGAFLRTAGLDRWPRSLMLVPDTIRAGAANKASILARSLVPGRGPDGAA